LALRFYYVRAIGDAIGISLHSLRHKKFGRDWVYSGHQWILARDGLVANDPKRTSAVANCCTAKAAHGQR